MTRDEYIEYIKQSRISKSTKACTEVTELVYTINIHKSLTEDRVVQGFASVSMINGEPFVDKEGDTIPPIELEKTVDRFNTQMENGVIKIDHKGKQVGQITQSAVINETNLEFFLNHLAPSVVYAQPLKKSCAWYIKATITSDEAWRRVQKNELKAFSIGAFGIRRPYVNT